jgi:hypothetical protein
MVALGSVSKETEKKRWNIAPTHIPTLGCVCVWLPELDFEDGVYYDVSLSLLLVHSGHWQTHCNAGDSSERHYRLSEPLVMLSVLAMRAHALGHVDMLRSSPVRA